LVLETCITRQIAIYEYAEFLGLVILPYDITVSVDFEVEVDFNDSAIGFEEGGWQRPSGTFLFIICGLKDMDGRKNTVMVIQTHDEMVGEPIDMDI
jgi:hypothetical protein